MFLEKKLYTIKVKSKTYSAYNNVGDFQKHYVIAFNKLKYASHVLYNVHPEALPRIQHRTKLDLTSHIIDPETDEKQSKFILDVEANLYVPKHEYSGSMTNPMNDGNFHMSHIKLEDLLLYPFKKNLGIAIAYDINYEDNHFICFKTSVVDPHQDTSIVHSE